MKINVDIVGDIKLVFGFVIIIQKRFVIVYMSDL